MKLKTFCNKIYKYFDFQLCTFHLSSVVQNVTLNLHTSCKMYYESFYMQGADVDYPVIDTLELNILDTFLCKTAKIAF